MKILQEFNYFPYRGYRKKQVKIEPILYYVFLVFQIINKKKHVIQHNERINSDVVNKKKHIKKAIKFVITSKLERTKETRTCDSEMKREENTSSMYDN